MADSLQDQLLKAGLADGDKAKKDARKKRKEAKVARRAGETLVDENKVAAEQARQLKTERDRELNQALNDKRQRKAINAQIAQLINDHKLRREKGDVGFHFTDGSKVKKLYVNGEQQRQLGVGRIAIVKQGDQYELLPRPLADKIAQRDSSRVIICTDSATPSMSAEEEEWYKDFEVPDDLMW